jgi:hypothetical protein
MGGIASLLRLDLLPFLGPRAGQRESAISPKDSHSRFLCAIAPLERQRALVVGTRNGGEVDRAGAESASLLAPALTACAQPPPAFL